MLNALLRQGPQAQAPLMAELGKRFRALHPGMAMAVHKDNPITALTRAQVSGVLRGRITHFFGLDLL